MMHGPFRWLYPVGAVALAACLQGRLLATSEAVVGPDGRKAYAIECVRMNLCYRFAGEDCPTGYVILNDRAADVSSSSFKAVGQVATATSLNETHVSMLIQCRIARNHARGNVGAPDLAS